MSRVTSAQRALRYEEAGERLGLPIDLTLIDEFKCNRKEDMTNEGKPNGGKTLSASSTSKVNPKSNDQSCPALAPKPTKNAIGKSQKELHPTSLSQNDAQHHSALKAFPQVTLDEMTNLVSTRCSSKSHPKEPSVSKVLLLKHPAPPAIELTLDSDNEV